MDFVEGGIYMINFNVEWLGFCSFSIIGKEQ